LKKKRSRFSLWQAKAKDEKMNDQGGAATSPKTDPLAQIVKKALLHNESEQRHFGDRA
jgi:hypothetical protein